jgi:hypothetical protein
MTNKIRFSPQKNPIRANAAKSGSSKCKPNRRKPTPTPKPPRLRRTRLETLAKTGRGNGDSQMPI